MKDFEIQKSLLGELADTRQMQMRRFMSSQRGGSPKPKNVNNKLMSDDSVVIIQGK